MYFMHNWSFLYSLTRSLALSHSGCRSLFQSANHSLTYFTHCLLPQAAVPEESVLDDLIAKGKASIASHLEYETLPEVNYLSHYFSNFLPWLSLYLTVFCLYLTGFCLYLSGYASIPTGFPWGCVRCVCVCSCLCCLR